MGTKKIDSAIPNIETRWNGYSGPRVEEFIKKQLTNINESLAKKGGVFHLDEDGKRYLVFADETSRDAWEEDNERADLILGVIQAGGEGADFSMRVTLTSDYYMSVLPSQKGLYIEFDFAVKNKDNMPTGEDALVTFTFRWNNIVKTVNQKYTGGSHVRFAIDDYVGETGVTNISVRVTGIETGVSTSFAVVCNRVDLSLSDKYDVGTVHNLISSPNAYAAIPFDITGSGVKTVEWYLDGERIAYNKAEDDVTEVTTSRTKYISLSGLSEGVHNIQYRASITVNGQKFYSQTLYREIMVFKGENPNRILSAIGAELSPGTIITEALVLNTLHQFIPYSFSVGAYDPQGGASIAVSILLNNSVLGQLNLTNGKAQTYTFTPTSSGEGILKLVIGDEGREIGVDIETSSQQITEITSALSLDLRAIGKSNSSADKNQWTYNDKITQFNGFDWSEQSGWSNNRLVMSNGANIVVSDTPLSGNVTSTGKTMEFEFTTTDVKDDDAIICDLRSGNSGLLITASEASLTSSAGAKVSVKYKSGENIRIAFVINKATGVVDKQLIMIYVNGKLSGAANFGVNDNFLVRETLKIKSSDDVIVELKSLRFYDAALTAEQILNNYILYRDTAAEMLTVYDRNDIFTEGTTDFNIDALARQLPVMVITGDIPAIEATTNKNLQIEVDIEYTNQQNPELSFRIERGALRPQGTSSMSYPKKNLRPYTTKLGYTKLYDSEGNEVEDRLYAFRIGSQPVDCWCLKADYAESSGVHNTGIARLWNTVMYNAQINGQYLLRTEAQKAALQNNYPYDVRTAIDGFPILCFYRLSASSPLVFIGKYNFNNDKSTESVFGFKDIPGFDNSKMQCWEVLNNGHHLALFSDTLNWESEWADAFEGRYPDGSTNTTDLKTFAAWMSTVSPENFASQKWNHLDVYKVAAYYVYVMLFGAVDQMVKNSMLTSEDGEHWYFINYDNDTVLGVRNDGLLIYPPTIDRQTLDNTVEGVYAYAGHDSRLWNLCEGDTEFMQIVRTVYDALYTAGLNYNNVINVLDEEQCDKWCERVYNQDALYKYIGPFRENGTNNLFMCQGDRKSHRRWWLSRRFNLMDGKFVGGAYKNSVFEVKLAGAPIGLHFSIVSGFEMNYGYGVNNVPVESGILLDRGEGHTFTTNSVLNVGDPLRIYAAPNITEIDIHEFAHYLTQISIAGVYSAELGSKLEKLTLGSEGVTNSSLAELSGISSASALRHLDVRGYLSLQSIDLSGNKRLETLDARNSGLASLTLANGAPITKLQLPVTMQIIDLEQLPLLDNEGMIVAGNLASVNTIRIIDCPKIDTFSLVTNWLENINTPMANCSLELTGINWGDVDTDWLIRFGNFNSVSLRGVIEVTSIDESKADALTKIFGLNCFEQSSSLYIKIPAGSTFITGPTQVEEVGYAQYKCVMADKDPTAPIEWSIEPSGIVGVSISQTGVLTVEEYPGALNFSIVAKSRTAAFLGINVFKSVIVIGRSYPNKDNCHISGPIGIANTLEQTYTMETEGVSGRFTVDWSIVQDEEIASVINMNQNNHTVKIKVNELPEDSATIYVKGIVKSPRGDVLATKQYEVIVMQELPIMTIDSNPVMMNILYKKGVANNPRYLTRGEAEACTGLTITESDVGYKKASFDEFVYFKNASITCNVYKSGTGSSEPYEFYIESITLPYETLSSYKTCVVYAKVIKAPKLTSIVGAGKFVGDELDFPVLQSYSGGGATSSYFTTQGKASFPQLKTIGGDARNFLTLQYVEELDIDFSSLEELSMYLLFVEKDYLTKDVCWEVELPKLRKINDSSTAQLCYLGRHSKGKLSIDVYLKSTSIEITYSYGLYVGYIRNLYALNIIDPFKITLNTSSHQFTSDYSDVQLKEIHIPKAKITCGNNLYDQTNIEVLECYSLDSWYAPRRLHTIMFHAPVASEHGITSFNTNLGASVPEDQPKILYLKEGATGYDEGIWIAPPLSDYIKSYTL